MTDSRPRSAANSTSAPARQGEASAPGIQCESSCERLWAAHVVEVSKHLSGDLFVKPVPTRRMEAFAPSK